MDVFDSTGKKVGSVERIRMGDPEADTAQGQGAAGAADPLTRFADALGVTPNPDLPPALADRLLRRGFIKINGKGLLSRDFFVEADQIDRVDERSVHLASTAEELSG